MTDVIPKPPFYTREKTPTVIQMEAIECGAACLGMILGYYGKYVTLEELRSACGVTRDGVNALSILMAAEKYGLNCEGHRVELEELYDMPLPLIAFWNFDHFVVIEGFSKNYVYINDPALGPIRISYEEFETSFTGLILIFEVGPNFQKSKAPPGIATQLYHRLKGYQLPILYAILSGVALVLLQLALPAFTQVFIDNILMQQMYAWGPWFIFGIVAVMLLSAMFFYLQEVVLSRLMLKLSVEFSSTFVWHILRLPLSFYNQRYSGEVANRVNLNDSVAHAISKKLCVLLIDAFSTVVFGAVMFYYDSLIALIGVLMSLGNLALLNYLYRSRTDAYACYQNTLGKSYAYSISSLKSMETIKATSMENKVFSKWVGYYTRTVNALQTIDKKDVIANIVPSFLETLTMIIVLGLGSWRVINGYMTIGMLIALKILMQNFMAPIVSLVNSLQTIQLLIVDFNRLDDVLKNPVDKELLENGDRPQDVTTAGQLLKLKGFTEVRQVTFGYNPLADPILKDISFSVNPGKTIALVGTSGSGKSTLAKIIGGLFIPWKGVIFFDHIPRNQLARDVVTNSVAIVEQEPFLFSASIKENLTVFEPFVNYDELITAAKDACIHDEIISRQGGYDLKLENEGGNLSGGQRQRLEIARALIKNPSILILDEATSAVDSETELKIFNNIRRRGCSCILIGHKLSTIRYCDEIIVIENGKVLQQGTHDELMLTSGAYKDLYEIEKFADEFAS